MRGVCELLPLKPEIRANAETFLTQSTDTLKHWSPQHSVRKGGPQAAESAVEEWGL